MNKKSALFYKLVVNVAKPAAWGNCNAVIFSSIVFSIKNNLRNFYFNNTCLPLVNTCHFFTKTYHNTLA